MKTRVTKIPLTLVCAAVLVCTIMVTAAQPTFHGQIRPRTEIDHKDLRDTPANDVLMSTHLRTRIGFTTKSSEKVEVRVELQDTRFMGGEPSAANAPHTASMGNLAGVDLLQGNVTVTEGTASLTLGRQKMQLGSGRFLSSLEWHPYSRAFDGVSGRANVAGGDLTGLFFLVRDVSPAVVEDRLSLTGLHYQRKVAGLDLEAYAFYDHGRLGSILGAEPLEKHDLVYAGGRSRGRFGMFTFEEEIILQTGTVRDTSGVSQTSLAWQLALRAGVVLPRLKVNLGVDAMSGDSDPSSGDNTVYRANYWFAHAYYGWMDYFVNNPRHGVVDYRIDMETPVWSAGGRTATLKAEYHFFTPQNAPSGSRDPYGQEIDVELHLGLYPRSNIVLGAALFLPGASASALPATRLAAGQADTPGWFLYVMPVFNF